MPFGYAAPTVPVPLWLWEARPRAEGCIATCPQLRRTFAARTPLPQYRCRYGCGRPVPGPKVIVLFGASLRLTSVGLA